MTFWDFLWLLLDNHPRLFYAGAIAATVIGLHSTLYGITVTINRNVFPVRWTDKFPSTKDEDKP